MDNQPNTIVPSAPPRRWPLFLVAVLFVILGPAIYFAQFQARVLVTPWYAPILATLGVLFAAASVWQRGGIVRIVGLVLLLLFCGFEWAMIYISKTPAYTGPAQIGRKMPAFATTLADGTTFTNHNLEEGTPTALVFFRGRW
jgi:hypothetical protein